MGNLIIDGHVNVKDVYLNLGGSGSFENGWAMQTVSPKSIDLKIELDLKSNGDVSFLLGDDGLPCKAKINNYIMKKLNGVI